MCFYRKYIYFSLSGFVQSLLKNHGHPMMSVVFIQVHEGGDLSVPRSADPTHKSPSKVLKIKDLGFRMKTVLPKMFLDWRLFTLEVISSCWRCTVSILGA